MTYYMLHYLQNHANSLTVKLLTKLLLGQDNTAKGHNAVSTMRPFSIKKNHKLVSREREKNRKRALVMSEQIFFVFKFRRFLPAK